MTDHILTTWLLTYAVHGALFAALAAVAERTGWGAAASRRDAFWKLALVGGIVTSTVFVAAGSAPAGAAVQLSPRASSHPAASQNMPSLVSAGLEPLPVPSASSTPLRDAIAAARMPREPASSRTWRDVPDPEPRGLGRIARYIGFDTTRPKLDAPAPEQRGRNWIAQRASFDSAHPK